jgi:hypothetical protein
LGPIFAGAPLVLEWQMTQRSNTTAPFFASAANACDANNPATAAMTIDFRVRTIDQISRNIIDLKAYR